MPSPLPAPHVVQARACGMRYLGASPNCSISATSLFAIGNPTALLQWKLKRV